LYGRSDPRFHFIFETLKTALLVYHGYEVQPQYVLCDAAEEIGNGFLRVFPIARILMCWAHMKDHVTKKAKVLCKAKSTIVLNDINDLQPAKNDEVFDQAVVLFLKKWSRLSEFCDYFKKEWVTQHRFWYESAAVDAPSCKI
jgi:hypothetical protein